MLALSIALPSLAKRLSGNRPPPSDHRTTTYLSRLLFDRDLRGAAADDPPDPEGDYGPAGVAVGV
jgi:hypothetical protein